MRGHGGVGPRERDPPPRRCARVPHRTRRGARPGSPGRTSWIAGRDAARVTSRASCFASQRAAGDASPAAAIASPSDVTTDSADGAAQQDDVVADLRRFVFLRDRRRVHALGGAYRAAASCLNRTEQVHVARRARTTLSRKRTRPSSPTSRGRRGSRGDGAARTMSTSRRRRCCGESAGHRPAGERRGDGPGRANGSRAGTAGRAAPTGRVRHGPPMSARRCRVTATERAEPVDEVADAAVPGGAAGPKDRRQEERRPQDRQHQE